MAVEQKAGLDARVEAAKALTRHIIGWGDAEAQAQLHHCPKPPKDLGVGGGSGEARSGGLGFQKEARKTWAYEGHGVGDRR